MVCICNWVHARNAYTTLSLRVSILGFAPEFSVRKRQRTTLSGAPEAAAAPSAAQRLRLLSGLPSTEPGGCSR